MNKTGLMICGHGSRDRDAVREFNSVAQGLKQRLPDYDIESGFLEFAQPIINSGLDKLRQRGHTLTLAIPECYSQQAMPRTIFLRY